jgi:hypothetical protein
MDQLLSSIRRISAETMSKVEAAKPGGDRLNGVEEAKHFLSFDTII